MCLSRERLARKLHTLAVLLKGAILFQVDTDEGQQACDELGIEVIPTVQFWKSGTKLWEHKGIVELENDLGEGTLWKYLPQPRKYLP